MFRYFLLTAGMLGAFSAGAQEVDTDGASASTKTLSMQFKDREAPTRKQGKCVSAVSNRSFKQMITALRVISYDRDRLPEAKNMVMRDCYTSEQIKAMTELFGTDSYRLKFARYAYDFVYDKQHYAVVKEAFKDGAAGKELDEVMGK